jgi:hypothetical protein
MRVLGLDPSLTNFGWAVIDTDKPVGDRSRCETRGRFKTSGKMLFIDRYIEMRESLRSLVRTVNPDRVGLEFPVFNDLWSEGMYGLFLYSCEALKAEQQDVVFWSPMQVKAHARDSLGRPKVGGKEWRMDKPDMVAAAKKEVGGGRWNHNEADAFLVARLASRFWLLHEDQIRERDLTARERKYFLEIKRYVRGKRQGRVDKKGVLYRENERFFLWSRNEESESAKR